MAVPNNYIDKITKGSDSREICPAADKVRVNNENFEGTDLDEVLDEIAESISGAGGNIPTKVSELENDEGYVTAQDMADAIDDALGDAQVTVVPEDSVGIITSLGSDSNSDALAASMGKKLKVALLQIYAALGNYAFPDGKPTLDFDDIVFFSVTKTNGTGLSATGGDTDVALGDSLEVSIAITNDLYIIDDDSVVVTMGGQPVAGAWNASTMKVTIGTVTGNVVINVPSLTYEQSGLVLHLDCRHRGGTGTEVSGHWKSLVNYGQSPIDFTLGRWS